MPSSPCPRITTLIPTYRRPALLKRAIESVLAQSVQDFLIYVFDNASGDETASLVASYQKQDPRIHYWCHPKNLGLMGNFAAATAHIQTPFFSFLSDDDYLLPWFYEEALEGFTHYPEAAFSACRTVSADGNGELNPSQFLHPFLSGKFSQDDRVAHLTSTCLIPIWTSILYRKQVLEKVQIDPRVGTMIDLDFNLRVAAHFPFIISPKPAAVFVIWPTSTSATARIGEYDFARVLANLDAALPIPVTRHPIFSKLLAWERQTILLFWLHRILTGQIQSAQEARKHYFAKGGEKKWYFPLLLWSEQSRLGLFIFRKLYFLRKQLHQIWLLCRYKRSADWLMLSSWAKAKAPYTQI